MAIALVVSTPTFDASADGILEVLGTIAAGSFLVFVRAVMRRLHVQHVTPTFGWPVIGIAALVVIALTRIFHLRPRHHPVAPAATAR